MKLKFDYTLSRRFGVLEKLIYRLVINGLSSVETITSLLPVFSEEVIALSLRKLVNTQLLRADVGSQTISLSDLSLLLIGSCAENEFDIDIPDEFVTELSTKEFIVIEDTEVVAVMLQSLLPNIKAEFLSSALAFIIRRGETNE